MLLWHVFKKNSFKQYPVISNNKYFLVSYCAIKLVLQMNSFIYQLCYRRFAGFRVAGSIPATSYFSKNYNL